MLLRESRLQSIAPRQSATTSQNCSRTLHRSFASLPHNIQTHRQSSIDWPPQWTHNLCRSDAHYINTHSFAPREPLALVTDTHTFSSGQKTRAPRLHYNKPIMTAANIKKYVTTSGKLLERPTSTAESSGQSNGVKSSRTGADENFWAVAINTIYDVIVFLGASLGFIFQAFYYTIAGYPEKDLNGEIALVTGGGGGLGRLLSVRLARRGVHVVVWDINQDGIDGTIRQVQAIGGNCTGYIVDISKKEDVYAAADIIRREVGDITMLINNAGVVSGRALLDTPDHLIERSFNVNVLAHFWTTKAFLPAMLEQDHGHVVTIASLAGHVGISKLVDYCSSKFAAVGFDEALRLELESLNAMGVDTTCICPFFIQATGMFEDVNSRWVPTLTSEDVADRVIVGILRREKYVILPGFLRLMLSVKWIFPWGCQAGFLSRIVPDAAPQHGLTNGLPHIGNKPSGAGESSADCEASGDGGSKVVNNNRLSPPMLVQRTTSVGERVL